MRIFFWVMMLVFEFSSSYLYAKTEAFGMQRKMTASSSFTPRKYCAKNPESPFSWFELDTDRKVNFMYLGKKYHIENTVAKNYYFNWGQYWSSPGCIIDSWDTDSGTTIAFRIIFVVDQIFYNSNRCKTLDFDLATHLDPNFISEFGPYYDSGAPLAVVNENGRALFDGGSLDFDLCN